MTPDASARIALVVRVRIVNVPLAVQVVDHIDNIVNDVSNAINREFLETPV